MFIRAIKKFDAGEQISVIFASLIFKSLDAHFLLSCEAAYFVGNLETIGSQPIGLGELWAHRGTLRDPKNNS